MTTNLSNEEMKNLVRDTMQSWKQKYNINDVSTLLLSLSASLYTMAIHFGDIPVEDVLDKMDRDYQFLRRSVEKASKNIDVIAHEGHIAIFELPFPSKN